MTLAPCGAGSTLTPEAGWTVLDRGALGVEPIKSFKASILWLLE